MACIAQQESVIARPALGTHYKGYIAQTFSQSFNNYGGLSVDKVALDM